MIRSFVPLALAAVLAAATTHAQVSYTGGVYSQNFDTLSGTTNNTTGVAWTNNSTLPGWYSSHITYGVTNGTIGGTVAAFDSTSAAANVGLFSFGTAASTDRALGSRATSQVSGNDPVLYGVRLVNSTSQTITSFSVTFTGEQWHKNGATTAHTLPVQYQLGATNITSGTWTPVATFTSPVNTATIASLDGNAAANRRGVSGKISGISWAPGAELWVRVADGNESGNEQAMGIDDFHFIADDESGLAFNGNTSYVSMGFGATTSSLNTSSFTVECRFMRTGPGATASTGTGGVTTALPLVAKGVGEGDGSNLDANYFLGIDNATGRLCADFEQQNATNNGTAYPAGQNFPVFGSTVLQNGVFYHVAATYDTATAIWKLYVNGVAETTTQTLPTFPGVVPRPDNIQGLGIGTTVNSTGARAGFFHGIIDEARIWNYARSAADINANKDVEIAAATGLLGRYGFDEGTGTTAAGTNASGAAAPVGTLGGTVLPAWVNSKLLVANALPTVALTAPANNSSFTFPTTINLTATAADSDGSVAKVEFYNGAVKLGEDLTGPSYDYTWTNAAVGGPYSLTAVVTDNAGDRVTSAAVSVTVSPNPNQPGIITLNGPTDNATGIGSSTTLSLGLSDPEGDATTVTFYGRKTTPTAPGPDFSVGTLPDTQYYSEGGVTANGRGPTFAAQTQWYLDNRNSVDMPNLAFISHMGDIVEHGDATPAEWLTADAAMKVIENPSTSLLPYGIPYGVTPGNHDFGTGTGTGTTNGYNQYFGISRFLGRNYYGSGFGGNNLSSYQIFKASGLDFISISLEYNTGAKSSYQAQLDWADALLKAYPNHRAIVSTHWMVDTGNPAAFSAQGANIYNDLKDNPNLFLMLGGHVAGEGRRSDTFEGRTVYSVLQDYQGRTNGGDGWLRYFVFSPANNTITARTYRVSNPLNPAAGTFETDADSQFVLPYNQQSAVTGWIPLGTVNVPANGSLAELNWTGLEKDSNYEWYASANDGVNTSDSTVRRFSTTANALPVVAMDTPANNSTQAMVPIALAATATDSDGTISKVEFFDGGTKLGEDITDPFTLTVASPVPGIRSYTAVATDNLGGATLSSVVNVTITNSAPSVTLTDPDEAESFGDAPANTHFEAIATDSDGTISKVEFYANSTKIGEVTVPEVDGQTFAFNWLTGYTGTYLLTAKAYDNFGAVTISTQVRSLVVTNTDNVAPAVSHTIPTNGADYAVGAAIALAANGTDTDGFVSKIEFYQGTTKLGEDLSPPFAFSWTGAAAGAYTLTAIATDNDGATTTSAPVEITVSAAGVRTLVSTITETFDSMGAAGTTPPNGWSMKYINSGTNSTWTDSIPINANGTNGVSTAINTAGAMTVSNAPTANSNNGYNAQGATASDRVIATAPTSIAGMAIQVQLRNNSGNAVTSINVGYDIRRYLAASTANELPGYWLFYSLDNGTTWTNASVLNPTVAGPSVVIVPNTIGVTTVPPSNVSLATAWANGADLLLRWVDDNAVATSPDQIVGLDNVSITAVNIVGIAPSVALTAPTAVDTFNAPATINLAATATDSDGTISKVEFYNGGTKLGEDLTGPDYTYTWAGVATGIYSLTARATDNDSNIVASSPVNITVNPAPGSGTLTRSPYLNSPGPNSIVVRWRTSQAIAGRVRYGNSPTNLDQTANESVSRTDHEVKLTGLNPYTRYYYSVGSAFDTLTPETTETTSFSAGAPAPTAADYTFRTSPTAGTAVNTRIWIVGDCGRGTQVQADGRNAYYNSSFTGGYTGARVPDLNLQLGDNAYNSGTETEYQTGYFNMYANIFRKMPQMSTLGNHDANNTTPSVDGNYSYPYFNMFTFPTAGEIGGVASGTEHYYSFDYGNIHFICLDSNSSTRTVDNPATTTVNEDAPMASWLRQDLASTTATWIIAFWHHPPYSKGSHDSDTEAAMVEMRARFNPILENGGVDLVFNGHSHNYERSVLLDGNYGTTGTITAGMKKNAGNGSTTGLTTVANGKIRNAANNFTATATTAGTIPADGSYIKPLTGPRDHFGAVYNTAGMSGLADAGSIDHSAMYISYNNVGTVNLDVNGNSLTCTFVQSGGATPDNFTITKQGAADTDGDGISDAYEIANGLSRYSNDASSNADTDGLSNFLEFAFGLNPNLNDSGVVDANIPGALLTKRGTPTTWYQTTTNGTDFRVIYIRRKDAAEAGLVYTPQFSGDMTNWVTSTAIPTVIADGGDVEAVSINYPLFAAGKEARFFRLGVSTTH